MDCGCKIVTLGNKSMGTDHFEIEYCPMHAAAPEMVEAMDHYVHFSMRHTFTEPTLIRDVVKLRFEVHRIRKKLAGG